MFLLAIGTLKVALKSRSVDLFGSQIHGDLFGAAQWRNYQGAAKEFGLVAPDMTVLTSRIFVPVPSGRARRHASSPARPGARCGVFCVWSDREGGG